MTRRAEAVVAAVPSIQPLPQSRQIAHGSEWALHEYVCTAGPEDRPFEERHEAYTVAAVVDGSFNYHAHSGRTLLHRGALLLGNHGHCFECGHTHSRGDRCVALHIAPEFFGEVAATVAGASGFKFPIAALPAAPEFAPLSAALSMAVATGGDGRACDDLHDPLDTQPANDAGDETASDLQRMWSDVAVTAFVADLVTRLSGGAVRAVAAGVSEERRIARVLAHLAVHADDAQSLDALASVAAMSKFHFLRTFQKVTGVSPHKYVLGLRLRRAAERLRRSRAPVSEIAFAAGFPDLSTFNRQFRRAFGATPVQYRTADIGR